jgi:hypothetical protein
LIVKSANGFGRNSRLSIVKPKIAPGVLGPLSIIGLREAPEMNLAGTGTSTSKTRLAPQTGGRTRSTAQRPRSKSHGTISAKAPTTSAPNGHEEHSSVEVISSMTPSGTEDMPVLIVSAVTSVLLFTLISVFPQMTVATKDSGQSDINATLLREMASRGAKQAVAASGNKVVEAGFISPLNHRRFN